MLKPKVASELLVVDYKTERKIVMLKNTNVVLIMLDNYNIRSNYSMCQIVFERKKVCV